MITAIIIEDEPLAAWDLQNILSKVAPEIKIMACLDSVRESVAWLREHSVQLIFSDIHLGDGRSFEIFRQVKTKAPVIFITAYDEYALEAFQHQGVDYILKPFDPEDIDRAIRKMRTLSAWGEEEKKASVGNILSMPSPENYQQRFLVQLGAKIKSVPASEIAYFMADGKYLMLCAFDGARYVIDQTIGGIEEKLDPRMFFRINRKFIINFESIKEMIRYSNSRIRIVLTPLPPEEVEAIVSGERIRAFKAWLNR